MGFQKKKNKVRKPEPAPVPRGAMSRVELLSSDPIEMRHLKSAISLMTHRVNEKCRKLKVEHCAIWNSHCDPKMYPKDVGVSLRSRAPLFITQQIRYAILQRDWETATRLLHLFITTGVRVQTPFIVRAFMVILMNHRSCDSELILNFLRDITLYENDEEIEKYAILLHTLRQKILQPIPPGNTKLKGRKWKLIEASQLTSIELNLIKPKDEN